MRPIDLDQVRRACREAVNEIRATAINPGANLTPAERRHLQAVARATLILISEPASPGRDAHPDTPSHGDRPVRTDTELLALEAELHDLDAGIRAIIRLSKGRDLVDCPGYPEINDRREAVFAAIVDDPPVTLAGLAAKARVLKTLLVLEDYTATGEMAKALAHDVLRLHDGTTG